MEELLPYLVNLFGPVMARVLFATLLSGVDTDLEELTDTIADNIDLGGWLNKHLRKDRLSQLEAELNMEKMGRRMAESLEALIPANRENLTDDQLKEVFNAVKEVFNTEVLPLLIETGFNPNQFRQQLANISPRMDGYWSHEQKRLFSNVLDQASMLSLQLAAELPDFTQDTTIALLRNSDRLLSDVNRALTQQEKIWADTYGQRQDAKEARFEADYRQQISYHLNQMSFFGVSLMEGARQPLNIAFVKLQLDEVEKEANEERLDPRHFHQGRKSLNPEEAFALGNRLLIVAGAGYGKTTLLKWAAVQASNRTNDALNKIWSGRIPFYIRLRDFAKTRLPELIDLVGSLPEIAHMAKETPGHWVLDQLRNDNAIIMLDGLDEVGEEKRDETLDWLEDKLFARFPYTPVIVTTRPSPLDSDAQQQWIGRLKFKPLSLQQMDYKQITQFTIQWHEAMNADYCKYANKSQLRSKEEKLQGLLKKRVDIRNLARSPLLCGMLCTLNLVEMGALPQDQARLYRRCLHLLIERDRARGVDIESDYGSEYDEETIYRWLGRFAYWMMDHGESTISRNRATRMIQEKGIEPTKLVRFLSERTGILRQQSINEFDFVHRTFQEFLAARQIAADQNEVRIVRDYAENTEWEQTIVFLGVFLEEDNQGKPLELLQQRAESVDIMEPRRFHEMAWRMWQCFQPPTVKANQLVEKHINSLLYQPPIERSYENLWKSLFSREKVFFFTSHSGIYNLRPLDALSNLENLYLFNTTVSDISPIRAFENLQTLDLQNTAVSDISPIASLYDLKILYLTNTPISDISPIASLHNLQYIILAGTAITDFSHLASLHNLYALILSNTACIDITPITSLSNLRRVQLDNTRVSDISPLCTLHKLEHLTLDNTAITDFEPLASLKKLRSLRLDNTNIANLTPLASLSNLHTLYLNQTRVSDISPLASLNNLRSLHLTNTAVTDLSPLDHLVENGLEIYGL